MAAGDPTCQCHLSTTGRFPGCPIHDPAAARPSCGCSKSLTYLDPHCAIHGDARLWPAAPVEPEPSDGIDHGIPERPLGRYEELGQKLGALVDEKNAKYGDSLHRTGPHLRILYPDGIRPDQYDDLGLVVRILDKLSRIATEKKALGENPYSDLAGYGLLGGTL